MCMSCWHGLTQGWFLARQIARNCREGARCGKSVQSSRKRHNFQGNAIANGGFGNRKAKACRVLATSIRLACGGRKGAASCTVHYFWLRAG
jgi:hypothetical protein